MNETTEYNFIVILFMHLCIKFIYSSRHLAIKYRKVENFNNLDDAPAESFLKILPRKLDHARHLVSKKQNIAVEENDR